MIDIVIPTYKRPKHLSILLESIEKQTLLPNKVSIVYAGNEEKYLKKIVQKYQLNIELFFSTPSLCKQRNIGIKNSEAPYIFLCDDDIELPKNYLEGLFSFLEKNIDFNIATGEEYRQDKEKKWHASVSQINHFQLWYNYLFGLSIYSDLRAPYYQTNFMSKYISRKIIQKGNSISVAGWPRICKFDSPVMKSTIYGLGASMIRSNLLRQNLYNEKLPQHGIGDNYEVALNINQRHQKIGILREYPFKHYKAPSNRVSEPRAYEQRVKELKRVIVTSEYFNVTNRFYFTWSLIGNSLYFLLKGKIQLFFVNQKVIFSRLLLN